MLRCVNRFIVVTTFMAVAFIGVAIFIGYQINPAVLVLKYGGYETYGTAKVIDVERNLESVDRNNTYSAETSNFFYSFGDPINKENDSPDGRLSAFIRAIEPNSGYSKIIVTDHFSKTTFESALPPSMQFSENSLLVWSLDSSFIYLTGFVVQSQECRGWKVDQPVSCMLEPIQGNLIKLNILSHSWETVLEAQENEELQLLPFWLPDGNTIPIITYYNDSVTYPTYHLVNVSSKELSDVCEQTWFASPPIPSPDKKYVVFLQYSSATYGNAYGNNVTLCNLTTGQVHIMLNDQFFINDIGWK